MPAFTKFVCAECGPHFGVFVSRGGRVLCLKHARLGMLGHLPSLPGLSQLPKVTEAVIPIEQFRAAMLQPPRGNEQGDYYPDVCPICEGPMGCVCDMKGD